MENQTTLEPQQQVENVQHINADPLPQPTKNNKWLIIVLLIISLVSISAAGFFGYKYSQINQVNYSSESASLEFEAKKEVNTISDSMEGWETYTNSPLGFKIKYPSQVEITKELNDEHNKLTSFKGGGLSFAVMIRTNPGTINFDSYYYMDNPIKEKTTLAGRTANIYEMTNGYCDGPTCSEPSITVVVEKNSELFHLSFVGDAEFSELEKEILSTFELIDKESQIIETKLKGPKGWISHDFDTENLTIYTPSQWKSSIESFPKNPSALIRFWEAGNQNNATIQLNIASNWDNIGIGSNYIYFDVAGSIQARRIDPPKMEEEKLDRYQSNFYFEKENKVYSFNCVHNWIETNIETCEKMLQTMQFTNLN